MNKAHFAASAAMMLALACTAAGADGLPQWTANLADTKLVGVDGSALTLSAREDGFTLLKTTASGAAQTTAFAFVSEKLGTVADSADIAQVTGFFRVDDSGIEIQFADGHRETLAALGDGLSLTARPASGGSSCRAWYPSGHVFGVAERRAAVVAYAASLGLNAPARAKDTPPVSACIAPPAPKAIAARAPIEKPSGGTGALAPLASVAVRASEVHAVPEATSVVAPAPVAAVVTAAQPVVPTPAPAAPAMASPLPAQLPSSPAAAGAPIAAKSDGVTPGRGASDCLSVESDGASLGFRNRCAYSVTFAYCVQDRGDPKTPCDIETHAGDVAASSFLALLRDTNIRSEDAEHNFHWVGCSGGATDVTAYLDRAEPASGRCVIKPNQTLTKSDTPKTNEGVKS
jgi:hypothetical protein